ncbi:SDR family oxidoreductase [Kineococcus sp. NUM-3379]
MRYGDEEAAGSAAPLRGRRAVVTGAAGGVGRALAEALLGAGASVALLDRRPLPFRAEDVPAASGATAFGVVADVADVDSMLRARGAVHDRLGGADLVVANAGIMVGGAFESSSAQQWRRMVDVNLSGSLITARVFAGDLLDAADRGAPSDLVFTGSIASYLLFPRFTAYSATAAAISQLSRTLRTEVGPRGVRVRHVEPGVTLTGLGAGIDDPDAVAHLAALRSAERPLTPEDVADTVVFTATFPPEVNVAELVVMPTRHD